MFSIVLAGKSDEEARKFVNALQIFGLGYSWGGYESLAVVVNINDRTVARKDYGGAIIRLQIGLENPEDLITDLNRGFAALES